jgi:hypothetical protein
MTKDLQDVIGRHVEHDGHVGNVDMLDMVNIVGIINILLCTSLIFNKFN